MTKEQAENLHIGDYVIYKSRKEKICGIRVRGIAAPHFSLSESGWISWRLCSLFK